MYYLMPRLHYRCGMCAEINTNMDDLAI